MARIKSKQLEGFRNSQTADFTKLGASETEFVSEKALYNTFVKFSDLREERPTGRPQNAASVTAADRKMPLGGRIIQTGNAADDIEVFVNGLRIGVDSIAIDGSEITLSKLAYDIDRTDDVVFVYRSEI
jgi:hypothetical protein